MTARLRWTPQVRRHKDSLADQLQATRAAHAQDLRHFNEMEQALTVASQHMLKKMPILPAAP